MEIRGQSSYGVRSQWTEWARIKTKKVNGLNLLHRSAQKVLRRVWDWRAPGIPWDTDCHRLCRNNDRTLKQLSRVFLQSLE